MRCDVLCAIYDERPPRAPSAVMYSTILYSAVQRSAVHEGGAEMEGVASECL